jgi:hypothetical protein
VTGALRKLDNKELHILCYSRSIVRENQIEEDKIGGAWSTNDGDEKCARNFDWKV